MQSENQVIRQLIDDLVERGGELYWHDLSLYDFDDEIEAWDTLALEADDRVADIEEAARAQEELLGGSMPPRSFVESARDLGFFDLFTESTGLLYSFSWVRGNLSYPGLSEMLFTVPEWLCSHEDGRRLAGMGMPDNPGDAPAYSLAAAFEFETGARECLWLYCGGDAAWDGGLQLVPLGASYHEVVAMLLTGCAAALVLPPDEADAALEELADGPHVELAAELVRGVRQLCEACAEIELLTDGPDGPVLMSHQIERLRSRLDVVAAQLPDGESLPFGRSPVAVNVVAIGTRTRDERFRDEDPGGALLLDAARRGDVAAVKAQLDAGVDPNTRGADQETPLALALFAEDGPDAPTASLLLERGADATLKSTRASTPLHYVAHTSRVKIARRLLAAGADPNAVDEMGSPPLFDAINNHQLAMLKVLLEAGANPNIVSETGWAALNLAEVSGTPEILRLLEEYGANKG